MEWISIEKYLPKEFEEVLLTDLRGYWVGMYQICETLEKQKVLIWWACNPNANTLGHPPFLVHKPKYWSIISNPKPLEISSTNERFEKLECK